LWAFNDLALVLSMFMLSFNDLALVMSMFMLSFNDLALVLSMFMFSFIFMIVCGLFEWKQVCAGCFWLFGYTCICIVVGDPIIERVWIPLIDRFNVTIFLCLSEIRNWISNIVCRDLLVFDYWKWEIVFRLGDIDGIIEHNCLNFFIIYENNDAWHYINIKHWLYELFRF
jgi:hypothetical protein